MTDAASRDASTGAHDAPATVHHDAGVLPDALAQHDAAVSHDAPDPCAGVMCNTPPQATCSNTTTLISYSATGTCSNGTCSYASTMQTCASGCDGDACVTSATDACGVCDRMWQCDAGLDQWSSIYDSSGLGCEDQRTGTTLRCDGDMDGGGTWATTSFGMALYFPGLQGSVEVDCYPPQ